MPKHPMQPIVNDPHNVLRFKENKIVTFFLDAATEAGTTLNTIALMDFSQEDREQFAQLIGYSLSGYGELSYVSEETYATAYVMAETGKGEEAARIEALEDIVKKAREGVKKAATALFAIHPDDLH